jgi:hypothetical protein
MRGRFSTRQPPRRFRPVRETTPPDPDAQAVLAWLKSHDLAFGVSIHSPEEWAAQGAPYGENAIFTLTAEGPFNHLMNYPETEADDQLIRAFKKFLDRRGLWYEQGYAWSFHFYWTEVRHQSYGFSKLKPPPQLVERDRLARRANEAAKDSRVKGWPTLTWSSSPDELIHWMTLNDRNSSWAEAFEDEEITEEDLWDGLAQYLDEE